MKIYLASAVLSFLGMATIVIRKIPFLANLPENKSFGGESIWQKIKKRVDFKERVNRVSGYLLLQKVLTKIRILTLKTDNKTSIWLSKLRQKSLQNKNNFSDNYWEKLKKK